MPSCSRERPRPCENFFAPAAERFCPAGVEASMHYIRGVNRHQTQLLPPSVEEYVAPEAPVRFLDAFFDQLAMAALGFQRSVPAATGRPPYDPRTLLKLYAYGCLQRVRSSRRLEVIWLLRGVRPDLKTIADFRRDHRAGFTGVFRSFNLRCRQLELFGAELGAIDGAKFKAVNSPKRHHTAAQLTARIAQIDARIAEYLGQLDTADAAAPLEKCAQAGRAVHPENRLPLRRGPGPLPLPGRAAAQVRLRRRRPRPSAAALLSRGGLRHLRATGTVHDGEVSENLAAGKRSGGGAPSRARGRQARDRGGAQDDRRTRVRHLRQWGHGEFLCRGLEMVRAEFTLSALSYNLRHALTVLGVEKLLAGLARAAA